MDVDKLLPGGFIDLLNYFVVIDKVYCFLKLQELPCNFKTIEKTLLSVDNQSAAVFSYVWKIDNILILYALCPNLISIKCNDKDLLPNYELIYLKLTGYGKVS